MTRAKLRRAATTLDTLDGWTDMADLYPTKFNPAQIVNGALFSQPDTPSTYEPLNDPNELVSHVMIARDIGMADNYEVLIRWRTDLSGQVAWISQASPVANLDLDAADPEELAVMAVSDVSIDATYIQNVVMPASTSDVFDPVVYHSIDGTGAPGIPVTTSEPTWVGIRCENGMLSYSFNGAKRRKPVPRPAYATGTWAGVHIIGIDYEIGAQPEALGGGTVVAPSPVIVDLSRARAL